MLLPRLPQRPEAALVISTPSWVRTDLPRRPAHTPPGLPPPPLSSVDLEAVTVFSMESDVPFPPPEYRVWEEGS